MTGGKPAFAFAFAFALGGCIGAPRRDSCGAKIGTPGFEGIGALLNIPNSPGGSGAKEGAGTGRKGGDIDVPDDGPTEGGGGAKEKLFDGCGGCKGPLKGSPPVIGCILCVLKPHEFPEALEGDAERRDDVAAAEAIGLLVGAVKVLGGPVSED